MTYTVTDSLGNVPSYLTVNPTTTAVTLTFSSINPADVGQKNVKLEVCMTYYPTNCKSFQFIVEFLPPCTVNSYVAYSPTTGPRLGENYLLG